MATGSATDDDRASARVRAPGGVARRLLEALVFAPGRSSATLLVVVPYLWLGYYVVTTAFGFRSDPIVGGDWLTLTFTSYALFASLGLAHRILRVGLTELTEEYLVDVVVLTWLTVFYFVWMLAREPVSESTSIEELYAPLLEGSPEAVLWSAILAVTVLVVAGAIHWPKPETKLFRSEFRAAMVTFPAAVTAAVLLLQPGAASILWPLVGGVFVGTLVGGLTRIQSVLGSVASGAFAVVSLGVWTLGATLWLFAYRSQPPSRHVVLEHVGRGSRETTDRDAGWRLVGSRNATYGDRDTTLGDEPSTPANEE